MKKKSTFLCLVSLSLTPFLSKSQNIFSGERVQIVGSFQSYLTTPYGTDYRTTTFRRLSTSTGTPTDGRGQWTSTINVRTTGGDVMPANMPGGGGNGFLFISGPVATPFQNKWVFGGVGQAALNGYNNLIYNGSTDMGLNMSTEGHYTFVMNDCGYNTNTNARFFVCRTTNAPVTVTRSNEVVNPDGSVTITITTSAVKSAEEFILIRYVSGASSDFSGATATNVVQATGSGTSYVATIPAPNTSTTFKYYIFTSTLDATALNGQSEFNRSLGTIRYDDNAGLNYTTAVTLPVYLQLFSGSIQNNKIQLRWKTSFEQNVEKFDVEKLVNAQWVTIGSVNATNASTGSEYAYTDGQINQSNIYRLKIVDKSGAVNFSTSLSIQNANSTNHQLRVYPTVVNDRSVMIELIKQNAGNVAIKLFSEDGKLLTTQNINFAAGFNNYRMNIPTSITKGNYFIQIITEGLNKTSIIMVR